MRKRNGRSFRFLSVFSFSLILLDLSSPRPVPCLVFCIHKVDFIGCAKGLVSHLTRDVQRLSHSLKETPGRDANVSLMAIYSLRTNCVALRCVVLRCVALRCVALRCVVLCCVALCCAVSCCVVLCCVALRCGCITLCCVCCVVLRYMLRCAVLCCCVVLCAVL